MSDESSVDTNASNMTPDDAVDVFEAFASEVDLEKQGVWITIRGIDFCIARAGGSNIEFIKAAQKHISPFAKLAEQGKVSESVMHEKLAIVFGTTIIKGWRGMKGKPYSKEAAVDLLKRLPNLLFEIKAQADAFENFRRSQVEGDAKN